MTTKIPNRRLLAFLAEHECTPEGVCSCGWDVANYDLAPQPYMFDKKWKPVAFGLPTSRVDAWKAHVENVWRKANRSGNIQLAQAAGPDGIMVPFEMEPGYDALHSPHLWGEQTWEEFVEQQHKYHGAYRYDDYEQPADPPGTVPSISVSCEEAGCRDPHCLGGHFRLSLTFPQICGGCKKAFTENEPRVGVTVRPDDRSTTLVEGAALASTSSYHEECVPTDEQLRKQAKKLAKENRALAKKKTT